MKLKGYVDLYQLSMSYMQELQQSCKTQAQLLTNKTHTEHRP